MDVLSRQQEGRRTAGDQFERLVNEVTSFLPSRYVLVPRSGAAARFLPVKDHEELAQRRGEIELVARSRGML